MSKRLYLKATIKKNRIEEWRYDITDMTPDEILKLQDESVYIEYEDGWEEIEIYDDGSETKCTIEVEDSYDHV